jgi:hypothetical protein
LESVSSYLTVLVLALVIERKVIKNTRLSESVSSSDAKATAAPLQIKYGQSNPQKEVVWAGRGDRWVTQIIYAAKGWPVAVKVVNISKRIVWIDTRTAVARVIEHGFFPNDGHFVRPGLRRYREWETLIYENANSVQVRLREKRKAQALRAAGPPCVQKPDYE